MRIHLTSVFVTDQAQALEFYTGVLGFEKRQDIDLGEFRWLTVVSPEDPDGAELLLEPNANPTAHTYQHSLREQDIPAASFQVTDLKIDYDHLVSLGVSFTQMPTAVPGGKIAAFDDTCGNLIQLVEPD